MNLSFTQKEFVGTFSFWVWEKNKNSTEKVMPFHFDKRPTPIVCKEFVELINIGIIAGNKSKCFKALKEPINFLCSWVSYSYPTKMKAATWRWLSLSFFKTLMDTAEKISISHCRGEKHQRKLSNQEESFLDLYQIVLGLEGRARLNQAQEIQKAQLYGHGV